MIKRKEIEKRREKKRKGVWGGEGMESRVGVGAGCLGLAFCWRIEVWWA